jgi:arylsulfatase A-like enzyme
MTDEKINVNELNRGFYPFKIGDRVSDDQLRNVIDRYDEEILFTDQEKIARILQILEENSVLDNTMIFITSDHGDEFYEHKQWAHSSTPFCTLVRIPLIVKLPEAGYTHKISSTNETVELVDIVPTIMDAWGVPVPDNMEGQSLLSLISGEHWDTKAAFSELRLKGKEARSLVMDGYHLIYVKYGVKEKLLLYDLNQDPAELNDIAEVKPELSEKMYNKLQEIHNQAKNKSWQTERIKIDKDLEEHFKSLGYIK